MRQITSEMLDMLQSKWIRLYDTILPEPTFALTARGRRGKGPYVPSESDRIDLK